MGNDVLFPFEDASTKVAFGEALMVPIVAPVQVLLQAARAAKGLVADPARGDGV